MNLQALKALQEAWKRIDDLEQKCAAARAVGQSTRGSGERALRDAAAQVDRLQVPFVFGASVAVFRSCLQVQRRDRPAWMGSDDDTAWSGSTSPLLVVLSLVSSPRCAQAQLQGMKAERATIEQHRKMEAAESRKALAEIDFLQVSWHATLLLRGTTAM